MSRDPGITMPGSQLAELRFFHVITKLIFTVFHRRPEILANRATPVNRASPPHVIGPLILEKAISSYVKRPTLMQELVA